MLISPTTYEELNVRERSLTAFWPQYFDRDRTRAMGRRVSKGDATGKPNAKDVLEAAQQAGYYAEIDSFRKYPRTWWDDPGLVLVDIMGQKKSFALKKIAPEVKEAKKNRLERTKEKRSKK